MTGRQTAAGRAPFGTSKAHPARVYDCLLGGKDNFAADREAAQKLLEFLPGARTMARENRAFLGRVVRYLVAEAGIRQFLDIGTGLPSVNNVHEVAQSIAPECRVVYADNDPIAQAHRDRGVSSLGRSADEFAELAFAGLEMAEPGLVLVSEWRPEDDGPRPLPAEVSMYGGVGRKPG